jgi:hypothetical protein
VTEGEREWTANLISKSYASFLVELNRFDEHHRLEFNWGFFSPHRLTLDGVEIDSNNFQIGAHSARFQVQFKFTLLSSIIRRITPSVTGIGGIEIWCDSRPILRAN